MGRMKIFGIVILSLILLAVSVTATCTDDSGVCYPQIMEYSLNPCISRIINLSTSFEIKINATACPDSNGELSGGGLSCLWACGSGSSTEDGCWACYYDMLKDSCDNVSVRAILYYNATGTQVQDSGWQTSDFSYNQKSITSLLMNKTGNYQLKLFAKNADDATALPFAVKTLNYSVASTGDIVNYGECITRSGDAYLDVSTRENEGLPRSLGGLGIMTSSLIWTLLMVVLGAGILFGIGFSRDQGWGVSLGVVFFVEMVLLLIGAIYGFMHWALVILFFIILTAIAWKLIREMF